MLKFDPSANQTLIVFAVNKHKFLKIMYALKLIFYLTPSFSSQLLARLTATDVGGLCPPRRSQSTLGAARLPPALKYI